MYIGNLWLRYENIVKSLAQQNISGLPTLLTSDRCTDSSMKIDNFTTDVKRYLQEFYANTTMSKLSGLDIDAFKTASNSLRQHLVTVSNCLLDYQQLLDSINSWLAEVTASLQGEMEDLDLTPASNLFSTLDGECATLHAFLELNSAASLQHLVDQIGSLYDTPLSLDDVDSAVFSKLTSIVGALQTSLKDTYHALFDKFSSIDLHMNNSDKAVDSFLRGLVIWRYPFVNLENRQV
jgi:hypothetical protein